ncbi:MAG TPA: RNA polymerase sigma factor [Solirubrobacteraceae bacterium]|nr:RNA polymerase sigma factor [Solirubrobacteraceae bacterium]
MDLPPFQALLDLHGPDIHRFLKASVGPTDADDCYQETWISALRAYPNLRSAGNLRGWLLTIAARKAIDAHRARGRRAVPMAEPPEASFTPREPADDLWSAVRALPAKQRAAVMLRHVLDAEYPVVAATMGVSEAAARRSVHEGLKRLREEHGHDWSV